MTDNMQMYRPIRPIACAEASLAEQCSMCGMHPQAVHKPALSTSSTATTAGNTVNPHDQASATTHDQASTISHDQASAASHHQASATSHDAEHEAHEDTASMVKALPAGTINSGFSNPGIFGKLPRELREEIYKWTTSISERDERTYAWPSENGSWTQQQTATGNHISALAATCRQMYQETRPYVQRIESPLINLRFLEVNQEHCSECWDRRSLRMFQELRHIISPFAHLVRIHLLLEHESSFELAIRAFLGQQQHGGFLNGGSSLQELTIHFAWPTPQNVQRLTSSLDATLPYFNQELCPCPINMDWIGPPDGSQQHIGAFPKVMLYGLLGQ